MESHAGYRPNAAAVGAAEYGAADDSHSFTAVAFAVHKAMGQRSAGGRRRDGC